MAFPSILTAYTQTTATSRLNSPSHSGLHNTVSSALGQVEAVIGLADSGSVLGTLIGDLRSPNSPGGGHIQTANKGGTGQTTFTKGDVLIAQSASVLSKLAVGTDGLALVADSTQPVGIKWGVPNNKPTVRTYGFSSSVITWNRPSTLSYIIVECVGGGAGGGAAEGGGGTTSFGGGGGAGAYTRKYVTASTLGITEQISIGAAGIGGTTPSNSGGTGGTTVFGASSILSAAGGSGGGGASGSGGNSGAGGVATTGDLNLDGQDGSPGIFASTSNGLGGLGGYSFFTTKGRGGTGARVVSPTISTAGGIGQSGFVAITEY